MRSQNHLPILQLRSSTLFFSTQLQRKALNIATSFEEKLCENHELLHWLVKELKAVRVWDDDAMTILLPFVSIGNLKQF